MTKEELLKPFHIPPERIYGTLFSQARNPTIAKLFRLAKLAENVGFGIDKLLSWKQVTGYNVSIRNERDYVLVTLMLNDNVTDNVADKLTGRQQTILKLINEDNYISAARIAAKLSIAQRTAQRDLDRLKQLKHITRIGHEKGGYWKILKQN